MTGKTAEMVWRVVEIPVSISFDDLELTRNADTGDVEFNPHILEQICANNNLPFTQDIVSTLLAEWYACHIASGGQLNPAMEQIVAEIEAEQYTGGIEVRGGSGRSN